MIFAATFVMTICIVVFMFALARTFYHQFAKAGTVGGLVVWTFTGIASMGLFVLLAMLTEPYR